jgi:hypothetical protein
VVGGDVARPGLQDNMSRSVSRTGATESYRVRLNVSALGLFGNAEAPPIHFIPAKVGIHYEL